MLLDTRFNNPNITSTVVSNSRISLDNIRHSHFLFLSIKELYEEN